MALSLKRGRVELKIAGEEAAAVVREIYAVASDSGATRDEILGRFAAPDRETVDTLLRQLAASAWSSRRAKPASIRGPRRKA